MAYETKVPLQGPNEVNEAVEPVNLDMNTEYFDTPGTTNCSLSNYTLTRVVEKDSVTLIDPTIWSEVLIFDPETKILKIDKYAGLNVTMFESA